MLFQVIKREFDHLVNIKLLFVLYHAVILVWLLLSIFPTVLRSLEDGKCAVSSTLNSICISTYLLLVLGIIPLNQYDDF